MIDYASAANILLQFAASNSVVAVPLALAALLVQRYAQRPALSHLLWLIVLLKLVTPPLVSLPILTISSQQAGLLPALAGAAMSAQSPAPDAGLLMRLTASWPLLVVPIWLAGALAVCGWSIRQARHFDRLLRATSKPADASVQLQAESLAQSIGLKTVPPILTTSANISPMVWWVGGSARIYLPASIVGSLVRDELRSILAHEMGHVARGDHFVRWLECLVCVLLWWNPLAWWARKNLRICEEVCCDAYVLARTESCPDAYAGALVSAMEILARPPVYSGVPASRINGGIIERRIGMILSGTSLNQTPRWVTGLVLAGAVLALPFGCSLAQEQYELEQPEPQARVIWTGRDGEVSAEMHERLEARHQESVATIGPDHPVRVYLSDDVPGIELYMRAEITEVPEDRNVVIEPVAPGEGTAGTDAAAEPAEVRIAVQPGAPDEVEPSESE